MPEKLLLIIPAYNEEDNIVRVVGKLREMYEQYDYIIINDGSSDSTSALCHKMGYRVVDLPVNNGLDGAFQTGMKYALQHGYDYAMQFDADGQHLIADTCHVTDAARRHPSTLIIGSRRLKQNAPFRSKSGNFITRIFLHALTPVSIYDTQSGLRSFTHDLIPLLTEIEGERYEYEMRMLIDVNRRGIPIKEIPIEAVYIGSNNTSHFRMVCDSARLYKVIFANADRKRDPQQSHDNHL